MEKNYTGLEKQAIAQLIDVVHSNTKAEALENKRIKKTNYKKN